jgi:hypothetical protein
MSVCILVRNSILRHRESIDRRYLETDSSKVVKTRELLIQIMDDYKSEEIIFNNYLTLSREVPQQSRTLKVSAEIIRTVHEYNKYNRGSVFWKDGT